MQFADGARIAWPADRAASLIAGEVLVCVGGRPIETWRAPCPLEARGPLRDGSCTSFVSVGPCEIETVARCELTAETLASRLQRENELLWHRVGLDACRDDDSFLPGAKPVPGPWWFRRAQTVAMVVQGDPARLRACLPRRVFSLPGTGGRFLLTISRFEGVGSDDPRDPRRFCYHEVTPFVPVWSGWRGPGLFVPELYPDAWMAVILGREIHGFPKRTARIGLHDEGSDLLVGGKLALRVRWSGSQPRVTARAVADIMGHLVPSTSLERLTESLVDRRGHALGFSVVVRKIIGEPSTAGRTAAIDQIVRIPVKLDRIVSAERLERLDVAMDDSTGILHGRALAAWRLTTGFRFGAGVVERSGRGWRRGR